MPWDYKNVENTNVPPCPRGRSHQVQCVWEPLYRCLTCGYSFEAVYHEPTDTPSQLLRPAPSASPDPRSDKR